MCESKEAAQSKIDRLIMSIELLTAALIAQAASRNPESSPAHGIPLQVPSSLGFAKRTIETRSLVRSRLCGAALRAAPRPGHEILSLRTTTQRAVILRCERSEPRRIGHKRQRPSFETPRKCAAPQDDGVLARTSYQ
jgi:hypothetical protein